MRGNDQPLDTVETFDTIETFDSTQVISPVATTGRGARLRATGISMPAAAAGVLLITTLALGAGGFRPVADQEAPTDDPVAGEPAGDDEGKGDGAVLANGGGETGDGDAPGKETDTDPGEEPTKDPGDGEADPAVVKVDLELAAGGGKVRLEWTACDATDVVAWKVVRSADEGATFPPGSKDSVAGVAGADANAFTDADAPEGRKSWYRVVAVAEGEDGYVVRCASDVERVYVEGPEPTDKPEPKPEPKPTDKPDDEPKDPEPTDKPETGTLELAVRLKEGHPFLDWSQCKADGFDYYKVVASKDATVKWPAGDNDWTAAAIGDRDVTAFYDEGAPDGRTLWYRVFCVRSTDQGYEVLAASNAKSVTTPDTDPGPRPEPEELGIDAGVEGGTAWLDWESCGGDGFVYYKVVRSHDDDPSYLPWTDGTELVAVIENPGASAWEDHDVESGETWFYRVQAIGKWNGEKVLLGETRVVKVEVP